MIDALFKGDALWFSIPACVGTLFFLLRVTLMMIGHGGDMDHAEVLGGAHSVHDLHEAGHQESSNQFEVFSVQSALALAMGFGWGGLGALKGSGLSMPLSVLVGVGTGVAMALVLALLLSKVRSLASSGNIPLEALSGAQGEAATMIPGRGQGKGEARFVVDERERRCWAISEGEAIASRTRISVVRTNEDNTVTVRPV